jgi:RND family efflux transporter MFP subunit
MPGVTGFKLVKIDKVKVSVSVPEKEIGKIKKGTDVNFTVSALGDSVFTGRVVNKGVVANIINHTYTVKVLVENRSHTLLPGMVCKVHMKDVSADYSILVPQDAIQISGKETFVWMVKQGKALRQAVTTGEIYSAGVVIETGLTNGDVIIVQGQNKVSEGMSVK